MSVGSVCQLLNTINVTLSSTCGIWGNLFLPALDSFVTINIVSMAMVAQQPGGGQQSFCDSTENGLY